MEVSPSAATKQKKKSKKEKRDNAIKEADEKLIAALTSEQVLALDSFKNRVKVEIMEAGLLGDENEHLQLWLSTHFCAT